MADLKLLTEWTPFEYDPELIKEQRAQNNGKLVMKGVLQKSDTLNQNGRVYPRAILEREIRNYQKFIAENRALGECDHPESSVVELKNASHIVREAYMEGDVCYGTVELLDTPSGKILQSLVESGVTLGISSRGVGSTKREGDYDVVQDDFQLSMGIKYVSERVLNFHVIATFNRGEKVVPHRNRHSIGDLGTDIFPPHIGPRLDCKAVILGIAVIPTDEIGKCSFEIQSELLF